MGAHLPPGQSLTAKFPVVGERAPREEALDLERWELRVEGLVERPLRLRWADYLALPHRDRRVDIHCVTGWSRLGTTFTGVPLALLLERAGIRAEAAWARFASWSPRDHDTSLPLALAADDTWVVHRVDGEPLSVEHGYPVRSLTPSRYFYKSVKWLRTIELLAEDRLGTWERESSYHNVGDPWAGDQRFTTGSLEPEKVEGFKRATSFAAWRGPRKVLLGLDLRGWRPRTRELGALQLKNCDLRGAELAGCDLGGANLSLSSLRDASVAGAILRSADLEGVDFRGADLRRADLSGALLSAARFVGDDGADPAQVEGLVWAGASGLLEVQEEFLRRATGGTPGAPD